MSTHKGHCGAVDLGTCYAAIYVDEKLVPLVYGKDIYPTIIEANQFGWDLPSLGSTSSPSAPHLKLCKLLIGRGPKDGRLEHDIAFVPEARMGKMGAVYDVHGSEVDPVEVSGFFFGKIKRAIDQHLDAPNSLDSLILPMPAYFTHAQRQATIDAAYVGGFDTAIISTIEEPVAAVIDFVESQADKSRFAGAIIVVIDVGGGTTDATAVSFHIEDGRHVYVIRGTAGDNHLGGFMFDEALRKVVLRKASGVDYPIDHDKLRTLCQDKKIQLSTSKAVQIAVPASDRGETLKYVRVTREEFELESEPTRSAIERVVEDLTAERLDALDAGMVLAVGGTSSIPAVSNTIKDKFPSAEFHSVKPSETVARGASLKAARPDIEIRTVLPRSIGIDVHDYQDSCLFTEKIMRRNTPLPNTKTHQVVTNVEDQSTVEFEMIEGEHQDSTKNISVGTFFIEEIPPCPKGQPINVTVNISQPGHFDVEARISTRKDARKGARNRTHLGKLEVKPQPRISIDILNDWREKTQRRLDAEDAAVAIAHGGSVGPPEPGPAEGLAILTVRTETADSETVEEINEPKTTASDSNPSANKGSSQDARGLLDADSGHNVTLEGSGMAGEVDGALEETVSQRMTPPVTADPGSPGEAKGQDVTATNPKGSKTTGKRQIHPPRQVTASTKRSRREGA